jgi:hypothetical protein
MHLGRCQRILLRFLKYQFHENIQDIVVRLHYVIVAAGAGTQLLTNTESSHEKISFKILGEIENMEALINVHNPKLEIIRKKFVRGDFVRHQFV